MKEFWKDLGYREASHLHVCTIRLGKTNLQKGFRQDRHMHIPAIQRVQRSIFIGDLLSVDTTGIPCAKIGGKSFMEKMPIIQITFQYCVF